MLVMVTELIGKNIKSFRDELKLSQKDLAEMLFVARPVISNWENGKNEPSSSQLLKLSQVFKTSTDELLGNTAVKKKVVVVDTSALIKRPSIVDELENYFDEVVIPHVVISELNNLKDRGNPSTKQKAWLVMKSITEKESIFCIEQGIKTDGNNDEKIADIAIRKATSKPSDEVYLLTDDIYFQFLTKNNNNLTAITPSKYIETFHTTHKNYDFVRSIEFVELVNNRKSEEVRKFNLSSVDVNFHSPDSGLTPLICAVRNRDLPLINYLLQLKDIDLEIRDKHKYKFSAIHHATQMKNLKIIKLLVDHGADIDYGSGGKNAGNTPLMIASWSGFLAGVEYYLSHDSCVNQQDSNGYTPLMKACIKHDIRIVDKLIDKSDLMIRCRNNKKAIDYLDVTNVKSSNIFELFKGKEID
ncbi:Ankyrin motif protein [Vibrio crassostreae]|nr:Ankyrin motif protein [Vibrio crassostreae]CAK2076215.1 Ankyrin motif protein [Vibrio crassostreae]CAK2085605.1 Ankyrin motif protein [Vibrio crassostreae]CAK2143596.1 Ankyrin motif protein [Vibrio crassostreae]CAK2368083.1 Ankyrin motif protein [Vibrio crassostreae]